MKLKTVTTAAATAAALAILANPAAADHTHSKQVGNGKCVLLAAKGGEGNVQLPGYEQNPENRRHPLHVKVHLGRPGQNFRIGVYGTPSDPCFESGEYVNQ